MPGERREIEAQRIMAEQARRSFDLAQSPLLRIELLRLNDKEHLLLFTTHHIACDGWSLGFFTRTGRALRCVFTRDGRRRCRKLEGDYAGFADWQRVQLQGDVLEKQLVFWKQQLAGAQTTLELPNGPPRPPMQTYRGATKHFTLPEKLSAGLGQLSRQDDVHPVHAAARGASDIAAPLHGTGRHPHRLAGRRQDARRDGTSHRFFPQHVVLRGNLFR